MWARIETYLASATVPLRARRRHIGRRTPSRSRARRWIIGQLDDCRHVIFGNPPIARTPLRYLLLRDAERRRQPFAGISDRAIREHNSAGVTTLVPRGRTPTKYAPSPRPLTPRPNLINTQAQTQRPLPSPLTRICLAPGRSFATVVNNRSPRPSGEQSNASVNYITLSARFLE